MGTSRSKTLLAAVEKHISYTSKLKNDCIHLKTNTTYIQMCERLPELQMSIVLMQHDAPSPNIYKKLKHE